MSKKEEFKSFVSKHPELINFVREKKNTWQDFYEIYDMYGEEESAWSKFKEPDTSDDKRTKLLEYAFKQIGTPYGSNDGKFRCNT